MYVHRLTFWGKKNEKNHDKMIDPKSVRSHSRKVPGASEHQKTSKTMTRRAYFLHRKCSIRVIRGQGGPSLKVQKLRHLE